MAGKLTEFDLIARIRERAGTRHDVVAGIGDDAAILRMRSGHDLVISTDTLNIGVHFPAETAPSDIGWKALAVSLSDLAAMGAEPAWCTLNLTLPSADGAWLDGFLDGFTELAAQHHVALVGGDTTRGPLSVTVTVHGLVPQGAALRRSGAKAGDDVWVSGTLGDAAAGLALLLPGPGTSSFSPLPLAGEGRVRVDGASETAAMIAAEPPSPWPSPASGSREKAGSHSPPNSERDKRLIARLDRPTPRAALGLALHGLAHACIDVSDGLLADLGHILEESSLGAEIALASLPTSSELANAFNETARARFQLSGGDDYELCFTAPKSRADDVVAAAARASVPVARIGRMEAKHGLRLRGRDGVVSDVAALGYRHFERSCDDTEPT